MIRRAEGEREREGLASLGARTVGGLRWAFVTTGIAKLVSLAGAMVLARLLAPEAFGLVGFGLVLATYLDTLADLGTGAALIYWPDRRREAAQLTFLANVTSGMVLFAAAWGSAPLVADFFRHPEAVPILRALALCLPMRALGATHDALLRKDLRFRARVAPELALSTARATVSVSLAVYGLGAWSLVWGQLAGVGAWTLVQWRVVDHTDFRDLGVFSVPFPRDLVRPFARYGAGIVAVNLLAAVVHHFDVVVVGRALGATSLGLYQMAQKLPEATIAVAIWTTSLVLFPAFSRAKEDGTALRQAYLGALRYVSLVVAPAAIALALLAGPLIRLVFGPVWLPAAPILSALALALGVRALGSQAGDVLKATGRPGLLAALAIVKAAVIVPVLIAVSPRGATAVAVALAIVNAGSACLSVGVAARIVSVSARNLLDALSPTLIAAVVLGAAVAASRPFGLAAAIAVGLPSYLGTVLYLLPELRPRVLRAAFAGEVAR